MDHALILERFQTDTAEHVLEITHDDGVHRCMSYRRPETGCMGVQVTTWPGHIAISGDMGCYVFSRTEDMFTFHRRRENDEPGRISWHYWAEKVVAQCKTDGIEKFSPDRFTEWVKESVKEFIADRDEDEMTEDDEDELQATVNDDVLSARHDGEHAAYQALHDFDSEKFGNIFCDPCDWGNFKEYTFRFIWICYCIERVIDAYDEVGDE